MDERGARADLRRNALLAGLPPEELATAAAHLEVVHLDERQRLYGHGRPLDAAYFPLGAVLSIVAAAPDGDLGIEQATIGEEGMLGLFLYLGAVTSPSNVVVQVAGPAARIEVRFYWRLLTASAALQRQVGRWGRAMYVQLLQNVVCNRLHSVEERASRWLLMTSDRVGSDEFPITQEVLAQMLGVRRASVTVTAGMLQTAGLISYRRGVMAVVDRAGLKALSCECYGIIRQEFDRLRDPAGT
jgi:CRP-like cAMP-binding protein